MKYLLLIISLLFLGVGCKDCVAGHTEMVHREASTIFIPQKIGNVTTFLPIHHPEKDVEEFICDQYAE